MYIHVTSPSPALMQRRTVGTRRWTTACTSPCDVELPRSDEYRLIATDGTPGEPFRLPADETSLSLTVPDKGKVSAARTVGGSALFIGGGALAIMGTIGVVGGIAVTAATCTPTPSEQERCDWFIGGPGLGVPVIVVSALVLLGGVTMMVAGSSMWSPPSAPKAAKPPVQNTAFVREPTWTVATPASPAKARPLVVPLTLSF